MSSPRVPLPVPARNGVTYTKGVAEVISAFRPTKLFRRDNGHGVQPIVTALDFDDEGGLLLSTESDDTLQMYSVKEGKHVDKCISKKYGAANARFTHSSTGIIYSSTKLNNTIRYYTSHNNTYIRYFEGHDDQVTCLDMHPGSDAFISCSADNTVQIWDLGSKNPAGKLQLQGAYLSAWDPSGNVFAVASPVAQAILLYDFRNYDKEPFATFDLLQASQELSPGTASMGWTKLEFSNDGNFILLGTKGPGHLLLDAFEGTVKAIFRRPSSHPVVQRLAAGETNHESLDASSSDYLYTTTGDACFTSDAKFVLGGGQGANVQVWETAGCAGDAKGVVSASHQLEYRGNSGVVAWNPRYNMFATADREVVFWVPDPNLCV